MDITHIENEELLMQLKKQLDPSIIPQEETMETVALNHEEILDSYLADKTIPSEYIISDFKDGLFYPLFYGSALHEE